MVIKSEYIFALKIFATMEAIFWKYKQ